MKAKTTSLILVFTLILGMAFSTVVCNAAGNNMYNAYLSALNNGFVYYSLYDIDKNGVSELIVYTGGKAESIPSYSYDLTVYTIKNEKLSYVGELYTTDNIYGSAEKGLWTWDNGGYAGNEYCNHYLLKNGAFTDGKLGAYYNYNGIVYDYYINNNKVNKTGYEKIRNSLFVIEKYDDISVLEEIKDNKGQIGEVINHTVYTDIVAKINGCDIPSYNINGYTAVVAEDLRDYGFEVIWDGNARTLSVLRNFEKSSITSRYEASEVSYERVGKRAYNVLRTDIQTYVNGQLVTGHNIDGKTIIYFNDLAAFGEISYNDEDRVLSLEISGLSSKEYKEYVNRRNSISVKTWDVDVNQYYKAKGFAAAYLNGKELWRYESPVTDRAGAGDIISNAFVNGDTVYFGTAEGLFAVDLYTGEQKWKIDVFAAYIQALMFDEKNTVHAVCSYDSGVKYVVIDERGNVIYSKVFYDLDGTWEDVPNLEDVVGNVAVLKSGSDYYPIWQQVNIISK